MPHSMMIYYTCKLLSGQTSTNFENGQDKDVDEVDWVCVGSEHGQVLDQEADMADEACDHSQQTYRTSRSYYA